MHKMQRSCYREQSLESLLLSSLATWRLTHLLMYEDGPADLLLKMRKKLGVEYDMVTNTQPVSYRGIGTVFSCFWCLSVWVSTFVYWANWPVRTILAFSAIAIGIEKYGNSKH